MEIDNNTTFNNNGHGNEFIGDVSSCANDFERDLFKLVNDYSRQGLAKPDLVKKMEWVLGSSKMS